MVAESSKFRILLLKVDLSAIETLKIFLSGNGWKIEACTSVQEASENLKERFFDLLILENELRGLSGIEFAQKLRQSGIKTPVIFFTFNMPSLLKCQLDIISLEPVWFLENSQFKNLKSIIHDIENVSKLI